MASLWVVVMRGARKPLVVEVRSRMEVAAGGRPDADVAHLN